MLIRSSFLIAFLFYLSVQGAGPVAENPVQVQIQIQPKEVPQGGMVQAVADFTIAPEHHVFVDNLKFELDNKEGFFLDRWNAQPTQRFQDPFSKKERLTLEGQASLFSWLHVPQDIAFGERIIKFSITYQVCSSKICQFPKTLKFDLPLQITTVMGEKKTDLADFSSIMAKGKPWAYIFAFIGGLLTSFTPCIFPMIPITISVIGASSAGRRKWEGLILSIFYVLGIALTYSVLGIIAASTGAFFGSFLGNIWVVSTISAVFFLMGLSMFGLFEIQVPAFIRNKIGTKKTGNGFAGAFAAGLISGVVASPCIGPVLVSILTYVAQTAEIFFGFTLLFTFAVGMGLIFIVLGTFSGLATKLPRAGKWMNNIKILFGVILIFMSLYYLKPFFSLNSDKAVTTQLTGLFNMPYSAALVENAAKHKKPVIIDFWAEWCVACHELEEKTYTSKDVIHESKKFLLLKVDATHMTEELEALLKKYDVLGLPTVIFIGADGQVRKDLTVTGFVEAPVFLKKMKDIK